MAKGEFTVKQAVAHARRKIAAARRQLAGIPELFGDLDSYLERQAQQLVALTETEFSRFEREAAESLDEGSAA